MRSNKHYFILLSGKTVTFTTWNTKIKEKLEEILNTASEIVFQGKFFELTDHTYSSDAEKPRRLRSVGGALRRMFSIIKNKNNNFTNKIIIQFLRINTIVGDEEQLHAELYGVESKTKLYDSVKVGRS